MTNLKLPKSLPAALTGFGCVISIFYVLFTSSIYLGDNCPSTQLFNDLYNYSFLVFPIVGIVAFFPQSIRLCFALSSFLVYILAYMYAVTLDMTRCEQKAQEYHKLRSYSVLYMAVATLVQEAAVSCYHTVRKRQKRTLDSPAVPLRPYKV